MATAKEKITLALIAGGWFKNLNCDEGAKVACLRERADRLAGLLPDVKDNAPSTAQESHLVTAESMNLWKGIVEMKLKEWQDGVQEVVYRHGERLSKIEGDVRESGDTAGLRTHP